MDHDEVLNGIPTYLIWPEDNQPDTKACCWQDAQNKLCPSFAEDDDEEEEEEAAASATKEEVSLEHKVFVFLVLCTFLPPFGWQT